MKNILIGLLLILTTSCVTQKKCTKLFPCISGVDSIYIEKLDTVRIILPEEESFIEAEVPCKEFELRVQNGKLINELKVVNGILKQRITVRADTVTKYVTNTVEKVREVTRPVEVKYVPKFWKFTGWVGIASILLVVGYLGLKITKKKLKL